MDRRSFLHLAGAGAVAAVATEGDAVAAPADAWGLQRRIARLRRRWERATARSLARVGLAEAEPDDTERAWARAAGAMVAIEGLARVPIEDQVHPAAQGLLAELVQGLGEGLQALRARLEAVAEAPAPEPQALALVFDGEAAALEEEVSLSEASRRLNRNGLALLRKELAEEGLPARARREARRLRRLEELSARIAEAGADSEVLTPADPALRERVQQGALRWSVVQAAGLDAPARRGPSAVQVLGLIGCGLGVLVGGFLVFFGIGCAVSCDAPGLLLVALLGGLVIAACVTGIVAIVRAIRRGPEGPAREEEVGES
jgi:hypothetical protein